MSKKDVAIPPHANACLMLADGAVFFGEAFGALSIAGSESRSGQAKTADFENRNASVHTSTRAEAQESPFAAGRSEIELAIGIGEICFNTGMTGYQETLTDPSYAGQIITFTFPHIGNVGCNDEDIEAAKPFCAGLIVRERPTLPSNFRSRISLDAWLKKWNIPGICGIDTRALTRHIRNAGAQNAMIVGRDTWDVTREALQKQLKAHPSMEGLDLAKTVSTQKPYEWTEPLWKLSRPTSHAPRPTHHVVAIDYGEKLNILRSLAERGCKVTVVSAKTPAEDILKLKPDGIFLSNGPGDPAATGAYAVPILQKLIASGTPIFGICLGHQLLGLALGGKTEKLSQGHRGANQPVKNLETGNVEITSQNHGFAVIAESLPKNVKVTHISLFDGSNEGLRVTDKPVFSVQYHPESSPGPHDSQYLFDNFVKMMKAEVKTQEKKMRKMFVMLAVLAFPSAAFAATADDMAAHKKELLQNSKQETIALGAGRFLLFSGSQGAYQYAYSVDLVKVEGGVPKFEPLFIEDYDQSNNSTALSDGVGFGAESYHFDTKTGTLNYTSRDVADDERLAFKYQLKGDTLLLQEVMAQQNGGAPETLFKAADAKKN